MIPLSLSKAPSARMSPKSTSMAPRLLVCMLLDLADERDLLLEKHSTGALNALSHLTLIPDTVFEEPQ